MNIDLTKEELELILSCVEGEGFDKVGEKIRKALGLEKNEMFEEELLK